MKDPTTRRKFLAVAGSSAGLVIAGCRHISADKHAQPSEEEEEKVTPAEDLMQEHGVLKRLLLVYAESIRRIDARDLPPQAIRDSASLIRSFVEDYHEKNEENFLFPRLKKAGKLVDLVDVLTLQHQAGRRVTEKILTLATLPALKDPTRAGQLADSMRQFIRMYEVHEAREDTVLFPAFRDLLSKREYDALGEDFEKIEHQHFGEDGFEKAVDQVASIEKKLDIYNLAQFTPK